MQRMSKKDEITKLYFVDRENPATIAKKLNISKSAVTQVLQKDDRYKKEKEVRKKQNKIRHNEYTKVFEAEGLRGFCL